MVVEVVLQELRKLKESVGKLAASLAQGGGRAVAKAPPAKRRKAERQQRDAIRDANIKKIRGDPLFLASSDAAPADAFADYIAGVLGMSKTEVSRLYSREDLQKMRRDLRSNYLHAAAAAVRQAAALAYRDSDPWGSLGKQQMVADCTYRDKDGKHMADERFQGCMRAWYHSIRRVERRMMAEFRDVARLEFTREELALVDMEVQRALLGGVSQTCGFLMPKARDFQEQYKDSLRVVQGWRIADIAENINIVNPDGVLGKPVPGNKLLSDSEMVIRRVAS
ncbi:hypothetical protein PLESTB_000131500 [Pleodorina starrii]|uniref:Uncharacterized protein n=1 Tax=Pleodorina starrii TaxID=330485 RepID=A0A9W6BAY1_9CHLO|nr:hypothetical protein PLESTB_000131500 [Pleodorina starrii]